jgi:hypothetical protein
MTVGSLRRRWARSACFSSPQSAPRATQPAQRLVPELLHQLALLRVQSGGFHPPRVVFGVAVVHVVSPGSVKLESL